MNFVPSAIRALGAFSASRAGKWIVLVTWVVVAGGFIATTPTLQDITSNDTLEFLPEDAQSTVAAELRRERFPSSATPAVIVFSNPDGLTEENFEAAAEVAQQIVAMEEQPDSNVAGVISPSTVPQARAELVSADGTTMQMIVSITGSPAEEAYANRVEAIRDITEQYATENLAIKVSGPGGLIADLVSVFENIDTFLLIVTALLVLTLLIIIYRSPVVALVPILLVGLVFQFASSVGAVILDAIDFAVTGQTTGIMTVILFGAGTDYILFIASRFREELVLHEDKHEAMTRTTNAVGEAIASAGGTLMLASGILLLATLGSYRSLGPAIAIAVALMLLAALTLVPAVLTILGRFAFWPFRPKYDPEASSAEVAAGGGIWGRVAQFVLARPGTVLAIVTVVLFAMAAGVLQADRSYDTLRSLPDDEESVEGFELLREAFPPGELAPTNVLLQFPAGEMVLTEENLEVVAQVSRQLAELESVASVSSPAYPRGPMGPGPEAVLAAAAAIPEDVRQRILEQRGGTPPLDDTEMAEAVGLYTAAVSQLSTDLEIASLDVTLAVNPYGPEGLDAIPVLRETAEEAAGTAVQEENGVLVGGETAQSYDTRVANNRDTLIVLPLVLLAICIVLALLLRSVVAAAYLGLTILVTYFSTLGVAIWFFTYVMGQDFIGSGLPFLLFIFLNGLGVDYSIYLMTRVREEAGERELGEATERALARTGGVITSAGLILAGTFAALMTLPLTDLFQLGFAVSIGVLIDTFVTRTLIVPSIVKLLGRWNWWPGKLEVAR